MIINNQDINIDDLFDNKYMHKKLNNGLFLSDYQINVLLKNNIDPYKCCGIEDLLFQIDEILDMDDDEELDTISREIMEFNYYTNKNK